MEFIAAAERVPVRAQDVMLAAGLEMGRDPDFYGSILKDLRCSDNVRALTGESGSVIDVLEKTAPGETDEDLRQYLLLFLYAYCVYDIRIIEMDTKENLPLHCGRFGFRIRHEWKIEQEVRDFSKALVKAIKNRHSNQDAIFERPDDENPLESLEDEEPDMEPRRCESFERRYCTPPRLWLELDPEAVLCCTDPQFLRERKCVYIVTQQGNGNRALTHLTQIEGDESSVAILKPEELMRLEAFNEEGALLYITGQTYGKPERFFPAKEEYNVFALTRTLSVQDTASVPMVMPRMDPFLDLSGYDTEVLYLRADTVVELLRRHPWVYVFDRWFEIASEALQQMS